MVADTGCQSSIIPLRYVLDLGLTEQDLLHVRLTMRGAVKEGLLVIGAVVVDISLVDSDQLGRSTRLLCYVSGTMENAFLCREALSHSWNHTPLVSPLQRCFLAH